LRVSGGVKATGVIVRGARRVVGLMCRPSFSEVSLCCFPAVGGDGGAKFRLVRRGIACFRGNTVGRGHALLDPGRLVLVGAVNGHAPIPNVRNRSR
jgi:hypothetical protein